MPSCPTRAVAATAMVHAPGRRFLGPHPQRAMRRSGTEQAGQRTINAVGPPRMVKRPTGSGGEPSSPNRGVSAGGKARQLLSKSAHKTGLSVLTATTTPLLFCRAESFSLRFERKDRMAKIGGGCGLPRHDQRLAAVETRRCACPPAQWNPVLPAPAPHDGMGRRQSQWPSQTPLQPERTPHGPDQPADRSPEKYSQSSEGFFSAGPFNRHVHLLHSQHANTFPFHPSRRSDGGIWALWLRRRGGLIHGGAPRAPCASDPCASDPCADAPHPCGASQRGA